MMLSLVRRMGWRGCWVCVLVWCVLSGCRKQDPEFQVVTLDGRIEKIKLDADGTGEISVSYHSKKHLQEVVGTGAVTKDTEIMINGALATLDDLREGDRVRGEVRIEGMGDTQKQVALKINVDRATPLGGG